MVNRLTRDEILHRALDMIDSSSLDGKDRPDGVIRSERCISAGWLQDALDYFNTKWPFAMGLTSAAVTFTVGVNSYTLPASYLRDYNNGILLSDNQGRMHGRGFSHFLNRATSTTGAPTSYYVKSPTAGAVTGTYLIYPTPDKTYTGTFYYYAMPAVLAPNAIPAFPADYILVEFVRLRGVEWMNTLEAGSALKYADMLIGELKKSGVGNEDENDQIDLDREYFGSREVGNNDWMGNTVVVS